MKSSLIKFVIYLAAILVIGAVIYVFAFLRPNAARIEALERDIVAAQAGLIVAQQRDEMHPQLLQDVERLFRELEQEEGAWTHAREAWAADYLRFLPEVFDDGMMQHHISMIVAPHGEGLDIQFGHSQPIGTMHYNENNVPEGIWLTSVDISFTADYDGLISILNGFAHEGMDNRIISYSLTREGNRWNVHLRLDVLTQMPSPYRHNGNYSVHGQTPEVPHTNDSHDQNNYYQYHEQPGEYYHNDYHNEQEINEAPEMPPEEQYNNAGTISYGWPENQWMVGSWIWMGMPYYVLEPDGNGTMSNMPIRWWTGNGVFSVCNTPDVCQGNCLIPQEWYYSLDGERLVLISTVLPDMQFAYDRG
ncbi:MAG: hypothetical protein FWE11_09425 [Defluviitaleaceae bacterium]|nr:hypothetical protein [Defluviitaleaceae bacterium]